ncbi:hypothetical protein HDU86_007724 [Geranomyces michiganensis]|nr:hypothetical protein HDU86_007724 [Geranomyces michiganensis]
MRWSYLSGFLAVTGNYLVLTFGLHGNAKDYTASMTAYALVSTTAITESYFLEGKMRDVFLMERIVADAQAVNPGNVSFVAKDTVDLVDSIRHARLRRAGASEMEYAGAVRPWADGHLRTREIVESEVYDRVESGATATLDRKRMSVLQPHNEGDEEEDRIKQHEIAGGLASPSTPHKKSKRRWSITWLRAAARRWWKGVYLAWPDEYHEETYLQWQHRSFALAYGMAILLQAVSLVSHYFLDMNTFCKPTIRGRQSTYLCEDPGPDHFRSIYKYIFMPILGASVGVISFPWIGLHPSTTHCCATLAFALLFSGYTWLTIEASQVYASFEGMNYSDSAYENFDAYSLNVLFAAGGSSALPSHLYHALVAYAFLTRTAGVALGLSMRAALYDTLILISMANTSGVLVAEGERLARRYHALRGVFLDRCRDGGLVAAGKTRRMSVLSSLRSGG